MTEIPAEPPAGTAPDDEPRPLPLRDIAAAVGTWRALLALALGAGGLLPWALTDAQLDSLAVLCAIVGVLVASVMPMLAAWGTARRGERVVTPLSSPRSDDGTPLVSEAAARALAAQALTARSQWLSNKIDESGGSAEYPPAG